MKSRTALIMAGGTGGHVFPGLALARRLRSDQINVIWLGTRRGIEARLVPAESIPVEWISISGLRGKGALALVAAPFRLLMALWQSLSVMRRHRPAVVVGLGGFVSGPGGLAAWIFRRPLVIHEQNAVAGLTNRCLAHFARLVFEAFPNSFGAGVRAEAIGNPVREEFLRQPLPEARLASRTGPIRILVIGGSQGAAKLNTTVPAALVLLTGKLATEVKHQAGSRWVPAALAAYGATGARGDVVAFIDDMAAAYSWADIVICRAGALTVSELAAVGVAALLVPFPAAVDDHQTRNAQWLVSAGAAIVVPESELTAARLADELQRLCADRAQLLTMARQARTLVCSDSTERLARACVRVMEAA